MVVYRCPKCGRDYLVPPVSKKGEAHCSYCFAANEPNACKAWVYVPKFKAEVAFWRLEKIEGETPCEPH